MENEELKTARRAEAGCLGFALFLLGLAMTLCLMSINGSALCFYGGLTLLIVGGISLIPCFDLHRNVIKLEKKASSQDAKANTINQTIARRQGSELLNETKPTTPVISAAAKQMAIIQEVADPKQAGEHPIFTPRPSPDVSEHLEAKLRELEEKIKGKQNELEIQCDAGSR